MSNTIRSVKYAKYYKAPAAGAYRKLVNDKVVSLHSIPDAYNDIPVAAFKEAKYDKNKK
jgi:hypothetical protein